MPARIDLDLNELKRLYKDENKEVKEIATIMKVSESKIRRELNKLGFKLNNINPFAREDVKAKIKQTVLQRYGVEYTSQIKEVKEKKAISSKEAIKKREQTMLQRYGVTNVNQVKEIRDKMTESLVNTLNNKSYKETVKELNSKYDFYKYLDRITNKLNRKPSINELATDLKLNGNTMLRYIRIYNAEDRVERVYSYLEIQIEDFIKTLYVKYIKHDRSCIAPQELDFYFPEQKVAIEVNDIASHNSTKGYMYSDPKDAHYHVDKSMKCEEKGVRLIHIWEYEWFDERQRPILKNIIKNALGLCNNKVYARKLDIEIRESRVMRDFFNKNNIQGFRPGKFAICLVDKTTREVYMSYMMGSAFFGKGKYEWEVIRGATKLNYNIVGGASRIWKYFLKEYNPKSCVYYIDYNYFNGNSLPYLELNYVTTQASFKNYFIDIDKVRNRQPANHKEINEMYKAGKALKIYNAGTKVYVWERKENNDE